MLVSFKATLQREKRKNKRIRKQCEDPPFMFPPQHLPARSRPTSRHQRRRICCPCSRASRPLVGVGAVLRPLMELKYSLRQLASAYAHTRSKNLLLVHHACLFSGRRSAVVGSLLLRTGFLQHRHISLAGSTCMHFVHCGEDFYIYSLKIFSACT